MSRAAVCLSAKLILLAATFPQATISHASVSASAHKSGGNKTESPPLSCPGHFDVAGHGRVELVPTGWIGEDKYVERVKVQDGATHILMDGRAYFANECVGGTYDPHQYAGLDLRGKTLRYTTDLRGTGCGCNAALYLVSMRQNSEVGECNDYYCDANSVCGIACSEIDIQEANEYAWHSTLHSAQDPGGVGKGYGGLDSNQFRDWTAAQYSPGGSCIDTTAPFEVAVTFHMTPDGQLLEAMEIVLSQAGKPCPLGLQLGDYAGMEELTAALAAGMTPVVSYWSSNDMLWMDGQGDDSQGPCAVDDVSECPSSIRFYNFSMEDAVREFNCDAGFNNWQAGWSDAKKRWCCENRHMACPGDALPPIDWFPESPEEVTSTLETTSTRIVEVATTTAALPNSSGVRIRPRRDTTSMGSSSAKARMTRIPTTVTRTAVITTVTTTATTTTTGTTSSITTATTTTATTTATSMTSLTTTTATTATENPTTTRVKATENPTTTGATARSQRQSTRTIPAPRSTTTKPGSTTTTFLRVTTVETTTETPRSTATTTTIDEYLEAELAEGETQIILMNRDPTELAEEAEVEMEERDIEAAEFLRQRMARFSTSKESKGSSWKKVLLGTTTVQATMPSTSKAVLSSSEAQQETTARAAPLVTHGQSSDVRTTPTATSTRQCAITRKQDCSFLQCCSDPGMQCYQKNEYWAACEHNCTPGIDLRDHLDQQTPWSCRPLGERAPGPIPSEDPPDHPEQQSQDSEAKDGAAVAVPAFAVPDAKWQCGPIEVNTEYKIDDAWYTHIDFISDTESCCALCQAEPKCLSWSWVAPELTPGSPSQCWLRGGLPSAEGARIKKDGVVSGLRKPEDQISSSPPLKLHETTATSTLLSAATRDHPLMLSPAENVSSILFLRNMRGEASTIVLENCSRSRKDDCRVTKCCRDAGMQCYEKDTFWAACERACTPGIDPRDKQAWQTPWTCRQLGQRTPGPIPTADPDDSDEDEIEDISPGPTDGITFLNVSSFHMKFTTQGRVPLLSDRVRAPALAGIGALGAVGAVFLVARAITFQRASLLPDGHLSQFRPTLGLFGSAETAAYRPEAEPLRPGVLESQEEA